ncbi:hypothetical protein FRB99_008269 [Tulasnella sp. 403]|nr:hypothetical protein FRB99_008269 [Tulasnella sp. 403]
MEPVMEWITEAFANELEDAPIKVVIGSNEVMSQEGVAANKAKAKAKANATLTDPLYYSFDPLCPPTASPKAPSALLDALVNSPTAPP